MFKKLLLATFIALSASTSSADPMSDLMETVAGSMAMELEKIVNKPVSLSVKVQKNDSMIKIKGGHCADYAIAYVYFWNEALKEKVLQKAGKSQSKVREAVATGGAAHSLGQGTMLEQLDANECKKSMETQKTKIDAFGKEAAEELNKLVAELGLNNAK